MKYIYCIKAVNMIHQKHKSCINYSSPLSTVNTSSSLITIVFLITTANNWERVFSVGLWKTLGCTKKIETAIGDNKYKKPTRSLMINLAEEFDRV